MYVCAQAGIRIASGVHSSLHVDPGNGTQVVKLGTRCPHPLSHLANLCYGHLMGRVSLVIFCVDCLTSFQVSYVLIETFEHVCRSKVP